MKEMLMDYLDKEENVEYRRARAAMDVWLSGLAVPLEPEEGYLDQLGLTKTGGLHVITWYNCPPQNGHNDLEHGNPRFFLLLARAEATSSFLCPGSQKFVHHLEKDKKKLAGVSKMAQVDIFE